MEIIYKKEAYEIIGACMEVHKELGNGFLEAIYHEALMREMNERKIPFETNVKLQVSYKNQLLHKVYFADLVCYDKIIVELKAADGIIPEHESQLINYLKATNYQLGLLVNFGAKSLQYKRIVYTM
ncbi:MAG: GxxExxY protein [Bacteroidota bacterium]|nr:GxxExxY protein [Bacteroidota bacterium]